MSTPTTVDYKLGTMRGIGSSPRILNFCKNTSPDPSQCFNLFVSSKNPPVPTPPEPVPGKMKTVFLLELTAGIVSNTDVVFKNTLNYYWDSYPQEFTKCPIVDTRGSLDTNLTILDRYYNLGFRYFVGFTSSNILTGVLQWFNFHTEAIGLTAFGVSTTLSIPKNVFRFLPDDTYRIKYIPNITTAPNVYYIYQAELLVGIDVKNLLDKMSLSNLIVLPVYLADLTVSNLNTFLSGSTSNDILITLLSSIREKYIALYSDGLTFPGHQFDTTANQLPIIPVGSQLALTNNYNAVTFNGTDTSILWRNGYNYLGSANYSITALNILNQLNQLSNDNEIYHNNSHYGSLIFDPVTKDIMFPSILLQQYNGSDFTTTDLHVEDPYLGNYSATFSASSPVSTSVIPVSPNKAFSGKAIAFLEIDYITGTDSIINESLYYFWFQDSSLPKFPIVDISNLTSAQVADQLTVSYNQGYRVFIGPNQSHTLATSDILSWFSGHPSTICMSLISAVTIPTVPVNIYRLNYDSNQVLGIVLTLISNSTGVYYICDNDPLGNGVGQYLQQYCANHVPLIPYYSFIIGVTGSLIASNILDFLLPALATDVVPLVLNESLQSYLDLYNDVSLQSSIIASQYISTNFKSVTVPPVASLDKKLFTLSVTSPNTSYLWNQNREYLSNKNSSTVTSYETLNALKMTDYFLKGKDISLLGSHSGVLQFSKLPASYNNIIYPSILQRQYSDSTSSFNNFIIYFQDPLLGNFVATF